MTLTSAGKRPRLAFHVTTGSGEHVRRFGGYRYAGYQNLAFYTLGQSTVSTLVPEVEAEWVSSACSDLCGGGPTRKGRAVPTATVKSTFEAQTIMTDARWSRVQYLSHEDNIGLVATPVGGVIVCEIEVMQVEPADWDEGAQGARRRVRAQLRPRRTDARPGVERRRWVDRRGRRRRDRR